MTDIPPDATQPLLVDFILSLDGCADGDGWTGWWGLQSPENLERLAQEPDDLTSRSWARTPSA